MAHVGKELHRCANLGKKKFEFLINGLCSIWGICHDVEIGVYRNVFSHLSQKNRQPHFLLKNMIHNDFLIIWYYSGLDKKIRRVISQVTRLESAHLWENSFVIVSHRSLKTLIVLN